VGVRFKEVAMQTSKPPPGTIVLSLLVLS
jgi:hypothetical protein